ncbi:hypothetical protein Tsubulata_035242 [Turnera subulata]|uniref:F-box domain-containing protein n=1 Tax=Turnera subulata TaxID=218843 RepID=A0A9Q0F4U1_9ROSI|nr:hypothetical protein Tsubulata_035242 [Turnera subulata]
MANLTLPWEIVEEILALLPSKSIHRFRQVSKSWSSFLVRPEFHRFRTKSTSPETNLQKILQRSAVNDGYVVIHSLGCLGGGEKPVRLCFPTEKVCACGFGYDPAADDYKVFIATKPAPDGVKKDMSSRGYVSRYAYSFRDFIPQAAPKDSGYMVLGFSEELQHILKWGNLRKFSEENRFEGILVGNSELSEYEMAMPYIEALTSPYPSLEIEMKQLQL